MLLVLCFSFCIPMTINVLVLLVRFCSHCITSESSLIRPHSYSKYMISYFSDQMFFFYASIEVLKFVSLQKRSCLPVKHRYTLILRSINNFVNKAISITENAYAMYLTISLTYSHQCYNEYCTLSHSHHH